MVPATRYAKSGDIHIAYQVFGDGPIDLLFVPGFLSHVENCWTEPGFARWLRRLGSFSRVAMFDKCGTGLSDRVENLPTLEQRMDDARAVMDAAGFERAAVLGVSEGGSLSAMFAATYPERCTALVLFGTWIRHEQSLGHVDDMAAFRDYVQTAWGTGKSMPSFAPSRRGDRAFREWWGRSERWGASPSAALKLIKMNSEIDITGILSAIRVPTRIIHRTQDPRVTVEAGRELARRIPGAEIVEVAGPDHLPFVGDNADHIADLIGEFATGSRPAPVIDRVLATILFTDIVHSTQRARAMGDRAWNDIVLSHDEVVRGELKQWRGNEVKSLGDGFLATFDGPARAIRCALAIQEAMEVRGLELRAGLHTGEVEISNDDVRGIAVHIASRVASAAEAGELLVSRTVKDLVAGSAIRFLDHGTHPLKGIDESWQLFRVMRSPSAA